MNRIKLGELLSQQLYDCIESPLDDVMISTSEDSDTYIWEVFMENMGMRDCMVELTIDALVE